MFGEEITESSLVQLINVYQRHYDVLFNKLKKGDLDDKEERVVSSEMKLVNGILQNALKLKKIKARS